MSFFEGKSFLFKVAINAARPCSARAQNALSSGSGDTLPPNIREFSLLPWQVDDFVGQGSVKH